MKHCRHKERRRTAKVARIKALSTAIAKGRKAVRERGQNGVALV